MLLLFRVCLPRRCVLLFGDQGGGRLKASATGVCEQNTPFVRALTTQPSSNNFSPPPDLVFEKLMFPHVFFFSGVFFSDAGITTQTLSSLKRSWQNWLKLGRCQLPVKMPLGVGWTGKRCNVYAHACGEGAIRERATGRLARFPSIIFLSFLCPPDHPLTNPPLACLRISISGGFDSSRFVFQGIHFPIDKGKSPDLLSGILSSADSCV